MLWRKIKINRRKTCFSNHCFRSCFVGWLTSLLSKNIKKNGTASRKTFFSTIFFYYFFFFIIFRAVGWVLDWWRSKTVSILLLYVLLHKSCPQRSRYITKRHNRSANTPIETSSQREKNRRRRIDKYGVGHWLLAMLKIGLRTTTTTMQRHQRDGRTMVPTRTTRTACFALTLLPEEASNYRIRRFSCCYDTIVK